MLNLCVFPLANVTSGQQQGLVLRPVLPTYCPSLWLNGMFIQNTKDDDNKEHLRSPFLKLNQLNGMLVRNTVDDYNEDHALRNIWFDFRNICWMDHIIACMKLFLQHRFVHDFITILLTFLSLCCCPRFWFHVKGEWCSARVWSKGRSRTDRHGCSLTNIFLFHIYGKYISFRHLYFVKGSGTFLDIEPSRVICSKTARQRNILKIYNPNNIPPSPPHP